MGRYSKGQKVLRLIPYIPSNLNGGPAGDELRRVDVKDLTLLKSMMDRISLGGGLLDLETLLPPKNLYV